MCHLNEVRFKGLDVSKYLYTVKRIELESPFLNAESEPLCMSWHVATIMPQQSSVKGSTKLYLKNDIEDGNEFNYMQSFFSFCMCTVLKVDVKIK